MCTIKGCDGCTKIEHEGEIRMLGERVWCRECYDLLVQKGEASTPWNELRVYDDLAMLEDFAKSNPAFAKHLEEMKQRRAAKAAGSQK